jgi:hypothetical protein
VERELDVFGVTRRDEEYLLVSSNLDPLQPNRRQSGSAWYSRPDVTRTPLEGMLKDQADIKPFVLLLHGVGHSLMRSTSSSLRYNRVTRVVGLASRTYVTMEGRLGFVKKDRQDFVCHRLLADHLLADLNVAAGGCIFVQREEIA